MLWQHVLLVQLLLRHILILRKLENCSHHIVCVLINSFLWNWVIWAPRWDRRETYLRCNDFILGIISCISMIHLASLKAWQYLSVRRGELGLLSTLFKFLTTFPKNLDARYDTLMGLKPRADVLVRSRVFVVIFKNLTRAVFLPALNRVLRSQPQYSFIAWALRFEHLCLRRPVLGRSFRLRPTAMPLLSYPVNIIDLFLYMLRYVLSPFNVCFKFIILFNYIFEVRNLIIFWWWWLNVDIRHIFRPVKRRFVDYSAGLIGIVIVRSYLWL